MSHTSSSKSSSSNRTSEFFSLAQSLPPPSLAAGSSHKKPDKGKSTATDDLRSFHQQAGGISKDIASTSALLKELTHSLRHQSSVFDDSAAGSANTNDLVVRIKANIENLHARLEAAEATSRRSRNKSSQAGQEAANLVSGLQSEFAETAVSFKQALDLRTEASLQNQQQQEHSLLYESQDDIPDMSLLNNTSMMNTMPSLDLTSGLQTSGEPSGLPRPHGILGSSSASGSVGGVYASTTPGRRTATTSSGYYNNGKNGANSILSPYDLQRLEQEQQQTHLLIPSAQDYTQQRANAMEAVEANMVELGGIFQKLAGLVQEHGEMVQRVEDHVDDAEQNVNLGLNVLMDTYENLRSNRALAMRLFGVLVTFIIMFIVFFA